MNAQQVSIKLFAADGATLDQEALIPIFHRWIRENRLGDKLLIDVADYRHVPDGPGVMIVGDGRHYGLDEGVAGGTGLLYSRKRDPMGDAAGKIAEALSDLLEAAEALEGEPTLNGYRFATDHLYVRICSRLAAENTAENRAAYASIVGAALSPLYPGETVEVTADADERRPLGFTVKSSAAPPVSELRARL